jgi:hypothetical protein
VRGFAVLLLLGGSGALAQSTLPATGTTANGAPAAGPRVGTAVASPTGHRAQVVYSRGELRITADDSSLNQILRDVGRQTGMKITGSVNDDRVYGTYGPGAPSEILAGLLEGTGSNMLLREKADHAPEELILTPREGGVTPPNPNARGYDDDSAAREEQQNQPAPSPPEAAPQPAADSAAAGGAAANPPTGTDGNTTPAASATNPTSPNGVQTPQQIFQQLQQLQRAQPQQQANPQ